LPTISFYFKHLGKDFQKTKAEYIKWFEL